MLKNKKILLGITGGIAAYKSCELVRLLQKQGAEVRVVMTEGATKFVEITVTGAKTEEDAKLVVTSVARSPLVKTMIFGEDANCGRVVTAAGYSGASFDPDRIDIKLNGLKTYENGIALEFDEDLAKKLLAQHDIKIDIILHEGEFSDRMYTCDFSYDYVKINGSYRS